MRLRTLGAVCVTSAVAAPLPATVAAASAAPLASEAIADTESSDERRKARYKESDHVKAFYKTARYPAK